MSGPSEPYEVIHESNNRPYNFDASSNLYQDFQNKDKKVEVVVKGDKHDVQQHVHHHFHHATGGDGKIPVGKPINTVVDGSFIEESYKPTNPFKPSLTIGGSSYGGNYGGQSTVQYGSSTGLGNFATKPVYENQGPQTFGSSLYDSSSTYGGNSFGASVGAYSSTGLYKKELNVNNGIHSNQLQSDNYQGLESARAENYDCVCVPYDQCPSQDVIGRKDDLYLPLDPRNLKSNIDAVPEGEEERVITDGNGTETVVRIPKGAPLNASLNDESGNENVKKVSKREASVKEDQNDKGNPEAVSAHFITLFYNSKCQNVTKITNNKPYETLYRLDF